MSGLNKIKQEISAHCLSSLHSRSLPCVCLLLSLAALAAGDSYAAMVSWGDGEESSTKVSSDGNEVSNFILRYLGLGLRFGFFCSSSRYALICHEINLVGYPNHI
jgi:hypothetical protein